MQALSLHELIVGSIAVLTTASAALAAQRAQLDCTGITHLQPEQLTALFAAFPPHWDVPDLHAVLAPHTVSAPLEQQLRAAAGIA